VNVPSSQPFSETCQNTTLFSEPRLADLPASVTPTPQSSDTADVKKVRKPLVFLDWEAIRITGSC
jgi:hypothetical protein